MKVLVLEPPPAVLILVGPDVGSPGIMGRRRRDLESSSPPLSSSAPPLSLNAFAAAKFIILAACSKSIHEFPPTSAKKADKSVFSPPA